MIYPVSEFELSPVLCFKAEYCWDFLLEELQGGDPHAVRYLKSFTDSPVFEEKV